MKRIFVSLLFCAACTPAPSGDKAALLAQARAQAAGAATPLLFIHAPRLRTSATLAPVGQNGPVTTWQTADGVQVMTQAGMVIATRGFGDDIMATDLGGLPDALRDGGGQYQRHILRLDGNFGQLREKLACSLSDGADGPRHRLEICDGIRNAYELGRNDAIRAATQWIGPRTGYLELTYLPQDQQ